MEIDLNLTITGIIALSAILSPIFTTWIDNHYKSSREKTQNYELAKREALNEFIKCANEFHQHDTSSRTSAYDSSLNNLYLYFSNVPDEISGLKVVSYNSFENALRDIVIKLSKQIKKK